MTHFPPDAYALSLSAALPRHIMSCEGGTLPVHRGSGGFGKLVDTPRALIFSADGCKGDRPEDGRPPLCPAVIRFAAFICSGTVF